MREKSSVILTVIFLILLAGCSGARRSGVVIDPEGVDMAKYENDLAACKQISEQVDQKAGAGAVGGAVVGGAIGAIVGNSSTAMRGAGVGGVIGLTKGGVATRNEKQLVVKNCLRNRGYKVLN